MRSLAYGYVLSIVLLATPSGWSQSGVQIPHLPFGFGGGGFTSVSQLPQISVTSLSTTLQELNHSLHIYGSGFSRFTARTIGLFQYVPQVNFGQASGWSTSATFQVLSDSDILIPAVPADAVHGRVYLLWRTTSAVLASVGVGWTPAAQSPTSFTVGVGIRLENVDATRTIAFVAGDTLFNGYHYSATFIDASLADPSRQSLAPLNQAGSISPRIVVPVGVYTLTIHFAGVTTEVYVQDVVLLPTSRWRIQLPTGTLIQVQT